jgi:hypothetical protein
MTDIARLQEKLGSIPDPQRPWENLRHKLEDILVIGLTALLQRGRLPGHGSLRAGAGSGIEEVSGTAPGNT